MAADHDQPKFRVLKGLPPYGPLATGFPSEWARFGHEGTVVEFAAESGPWVGNFEPGHNGITRVLPHPNGRDVVVIAEGDVWIVDPESRQAEHLLFGLDAILEIEAPDGWALILSSQGLALAKLGSKGLVWHTRRLSWDGFDQLEIRGEELTGLAWEPSDRWYPFRIDLRTGRSWGGSYFEQDREGWEKLADE